MVRVWVSRGLRSTTGVKEVLQKGLMGLKLTLEKCP